MISVTSFRCLAVLPHGACGPTLIIVTEPQFIGVSPDEHDCQLARSSSAMYVSPLGMLTLCDPLQVTTGEEGFWPQGSLWAPFNPWGSVLPRNWSYGTGQDFSAQHSSPTIDFAVMHLWPDNWAILYGEL
jgi:hypothetical protein